MTNLIGTSGSYATDAINGTQTGSGGTAIHGVNSTTSGYAIYGEGGNTGVYGTSSATNGIGVQGYATSPCKTGVAGQTNNKDGYGVAGYNTGTNTGTNSIGVYGQGDGYGGMFTGKLSGIMGICTTPTPYAYAEGYAGVYGRGSTGVRGEAFGDPNYGAVVVGVEGVTNMLGGFAGSFIAIANTHSYDAVGLYCEADHGTALYVQNGALVNGYLSKAGGGYRIDHPTDPENKYLNHHFVESPEMLNVYSGIAVFDSNGTAVIVMPSYFEAANSDYRYQLTAVGAAMPNLHVASKISKGQFVVAGGVASAEVSWVVTGVRADKWALANNPGIEIEKETGEKGHFMHPELFGFQKDRIAHPTVRAHHIARMGKDEASKK